MSRFSALARLFTTTPASPRRLRVRGTCPDPFSRQSLQSSSSCTPPPSPHPEHMTSSQFARGGGRGQRRGPIAQDATSCRSLPLATGANRVIRTARFGHRSPACCWAVYLWLPARAKYGAELVPHLASCAAHTHTCRKDCPTSGRREMRLDSTHWNCNSRSSFSEDVFEVVSTPRMPVQMAKRCGRSRTTLDLSPINVVCTRQKLHHAAATSPRS